MKKFLLQILKSKSGEPDMKMFPMPEDEDPKNVAKYMEDNNIAQPVIVVELPDDETPEQFLDAINKSSKKK